MKYIVTTDSHAFLTRNQPAKLYKITNYRDRAILAATGTLEQMQDLADSLNDEEAVV